MGFRLLLGDPLTPLTSQDLIKVSPFRKNFNPKPLIRCSPWCGVLHLLYLVLSPSPPPPTLSICVGHAQGWVQNEYINVCVCHQCLVFWGNRRECQRRVAGFLFPFWPHKVLFVALCMGHDWTSCRTHIGSVVWLCLARNTSSV